MGIAEFFLHIDTFHIPIICLMRSKENSLHILLEVHIIPTTVHIKLQTKVAKNKDSIKKYEQNKQYVNNILYICKT